MKLKGKLLVSASALAMAGGMIGVAAPTAHAAVTQVGACTGSIELVKLSSPTKGVGITDQTVRGDKATGALAKALPAKTVIAGTCSGVTRGGDKHIPSPAVGGGNNVVSTLTPLTESESLTGNASCANGATAMAADATAADAYPLNGKISWKFAQQYTDLLTASPKNYTMQAQVQTLGFSATLGPDVLDVGGMVLVGVNAGATIQTAATGSESSVWFNPVALAPKGTDPSTTMYNTGYNLDLASAAGCADGTANNANLLIVLTGGGGSSNPSGLGSNANGLSFIFGQP